MNKNRSPFCYEDYVEILMERDPVAFIWIECDPDYVDFGYCLMGISHMYKKILEDSL